MIFFSVKKICNLIWPSYTEWLWYFRLILTCHMFYIIKVICTLSPRVAHLTRRSLRIHWHFSLNFWYRFKIKQYQIISMLRSEILPQPSLTWPVESHTYPLNIRIELLTLKSAWMQQTKIWRLHFVIVMARLDIWSELSAGHASRGFSWNIKFY